MRVTLPTGTAAELALPDAVPARRGVALMPDIMGLRPLFDDHCARLAADYGWAVCAVEPFPGGEQLTVQERMAAMPEGNEEERLGDLSAAADLLAERAGVDAVAAMGFCMGGMYAFKAAGTGRFDKSVAFYGMIRMPAGWHGPHMHDALGWLTRPSPTRVLAILGGVDPYTPPADVDALRALGDRVTVVVYPEADHGFVHDPARPAHRPDDAKDAWARVEEFVAPEGPS
jgi:carboxymethylenebutenolidase